MQGVIYILVNPAFPHLVKIGYADDMCSRLKSLNNTAVPADYHVYATYAVNARLEDVKIHEIIDTLDPSLRYNQKREFFEMTPDKAYKLLNAIATINGLQQNLKYNPLDDAYIIDQHGENILTTNSKEKPKGTAPKAAFNFGMVNIAAGEEILFTGDPSVVATVDEDLKHVIYKGQKVSLSTLGQKLLNSKYPVQGPLYFSYKGKTLNKLREEIQN